MKPTWKWTRSNEAYLGSAANPDARVYTCAAAPRGSRYRWTTTTHGSALAVSVDTATAQRLAREALSK